MPELPEVETVVRTLELLIHDRRIEHVEVRVPKMIQMEEAEFCRRLTGQHFRRFSRRGKYLIFQMDDLYFIAHMRMEGKFYVQPPQEPLSKHVHVILDLDDGMQLRYHDTRKFGTMELLELDGDLEHFHDLGPEPFSDQFNPDYCRAFLKKRRLPIKQCLLDQHFVAGVGNIYANEICFALRIDPRKRSDQLTRAQLEALPEVTRQILSLAIEAGGSSIRSYTSSLGVTGRFQLQIQVHGREGEACPLCGGEIKKITVAQRGTYYCPHCQKKRGTGIEYDQNCDYRCDRKREIDAQRDLAQTGICGR